MSGPSRRSSSQNAFSVARQTANVASPQEISTDKTNMQSASEVLEHKNEAKEINNTATTEAGTISEPSENAHAEIPKKKASEKKKGSSLESIFQTESDRHKKPNANYISRSVYFKPEVFNKLQKLQEKYDLSLSKIVNIIITNADISSIEDTPDI